MKLCKPKICFGTKICRYNEQKNKIYTKMVSNFTDIRDGNDRTYMKKDKNVRRAPPLKPPRRAPPLKSPRRAPPLELSAVRRPSTSRFAPRCGLSWLCHCKSRCFRGAVCRKIPVFPSASKLAWKNVIFRRTACPVNKKLIEWSFLFY